MAQMDTIRMLILGTGNMAKHHATHFKAVPGVTLVGAVDVSAERLATFLKTHEIPRGFPSLDEALAWGEFDAIANVTPDPLHHPTTMLALAAKKHVFCEKPLATDFLRAKEMTDAAEAAGVVNMVNLTYRNVAQLQKARDMVVSGEIGEVRHIEASYLQSWLVANAWGEWRTDPTWLWRLSRAHGSNGVLGDIGIHILDFATYGSASEIADISCRLKTFDKAEGNRIGEYALDVNDSFAMVASFENGALGVIHASRFATGHLNDLTLCVYGTKGALEVKHAPAGSSLRACLGEDVHAPKWTEIAVEPGETNYQRFIRAIREGHNLEPSFQHAANLQKLLDLGLATEGQTPLVA
jgi:predicted dehydrogenase